MAPAADEFVRLAMAHLGLTDNPARFSERLGLGAHGYQRVRRWLKGENEPDYEATMAILEKCGWVEISDQPGPAPIMVQVESIVRRLEADAQSMSPEGLEETERLVRQVASELLVAAEAIAARRRGAGGQP